MYRDRRQLEQSSLTSLGHETKLMEPYLYGLYGLWFKWCIKITVASVLVLCQQLILDLQVQNRYHWPPSQITHQNTLP